jgi:hypothetical protein
LPDMVRQYSIGCKLYGVFTSSALIGRTVEAIDDTLTKRGLTIKRIRTSSVSCSRAILPMWMGMWCTANPTM